MPLPPVFIYRFTGLGHIIKKSFWKNFADNDEIIYRTQFPGQINRGNRDTFTFFKDRGLIAVVANLVAEQQFF